MVDEEGLDTAGLPMIYAMVKGLLAIIKLLMGEAVEVVCKAAIGACRATATTVTASSGADLSAGVYSLWQQWAVAVGLMIRAIQQ